MLSPRPAESHTLGFLQPKASGGLTAEQNAQLQLATSDPQGKLAAILVVEDSADLRAVVVLKLQLFGYENVTTAADGAEGLALIREREFDLVILDIEMPRMNGFEVLTAVKDDPALRHLPVIVSSGLDDLDAGVRCIELGAEDFLLKPLRTVIFRARVAATLERKRLRDVERLRLAQVQHERKLLELEQEKSERLLLNVLPESIATRLKHGEHTIAEHYQDVTVLFADVVNFASFASRTDPASLVSLLNDLFSRFDQLAGRYGLEKIKTIGDSYLVVGGLPERRADHAEAVAGMALEMFESLNVVNQRHGSQLHLRVGLNSGPVVAGVIGRQKFAFDLWGSTVNLASRMQSAGVPDRVQVSATTYELLQGKFDMTSRGAIACKGLGDVSAYLLHARSEIPEHALRG